MDENATRKGSNKINVQEVNDRTVENLNNTNGYDFRIAGVDMSIDGNMLKFKESEVGAGNAANTGKESSGIFNYGASIIMRFKDKIKDIINGVTLKLKGDKDKDKEKDDEEEKTETTAKKKVVKKVVKKAPETKPKTTDDHEK